MTVRSHLDQQDMLSTAMDNRRRESIRCAATCALDIKVTTCNITRYREVHTQPSTGIAQQQVSRQGCRRRQLLQLLESYRAWYPSSQPSSQPSFSLLHATCFLSRRSDIPYSFRNDSMPIPLQPESYNRAQPPEQQWHELINFTNLVTWSTSETKSSFACCCNLKGRNKAYFKKTTRRA